MKFGVLTALLVMVLAGGAGVATYRGVRGPAVATEGGGDDGLRWLRTEFDLTGEQLRRVERLHADYRVVCDRHCEEIRETRLELRRLETAGASATERGEAERRATEVDEECRRSLEAHVREVAAAMGSAGERYLAVVLPRIAHFDHGAAPDLELHSQHNHEGHGGR